ncbi:MAG: lipoyl(octanoyl) transferase LipB [Bacteroidales bacterium]|nr:lipoyl(octanoyl) transferase LipB [Bacteroidales bacterium]
MEKMEKSASYVDWGLTEYADAWKQQEDLQQETIAVKETEKNNIGHIVFCEHPHVFTLGKSGQSNNLLINDDYLKMINATYYKSNRGGDITYHGPGQLVGYPIVDLEKLNLGVKDYVRTIEDSIIDLIKQYDIIGHRLEKATGVWLDVGTKDERKICAIGVKVSKSVTMHGFALNVNTDLKYFSYINPCGFNDKGVTSLEKETGKKVDMNTVKRQLIDIMRVRFNLEIK